MANSSQKKQKINQDNNNKKNKMVSPVTTKGKRTRRSVPRDSPPQRSSIYRGVTRHRWTGRYEAHLWDKNCWNESQKKKGRQVYLGAYNEEEVAARAYDLAALKYWGPLTILNFALANYDRELKEMEGQAREEYIGSLRRKSSGFSRGVSKYRGVARHHHNGRWEARIGRVFGNKYLYLGTYATQEEAAMAYDMAAIEYRGLNAVTNFDLSRYIKWLKPNTTTTSTTHDNDDSTLMTTFNAEDNNVIPNLNQEYGQGFIQNKQIHSFEETNNIMMSKPKPTNATTALGLLLQSSKFKEMMEMTSVVAECPSPPPELDPTPCTNIPDDIQTYFEYHDQDNSSNTYDDHDYHALNDVIFNELNSFMPLPQMFQCDFDITN